MKYKIKDLSNLMGVSSNTIRRYENLGYLNPERANNNYRFYNNEDLSKTMYVRFFRKMDFTHPEILQMFSQETPDSIKLCQEHLNEMDKQITMLIKSRHILKDYIKLMESQSEYQENFHIRNCVPLYYTLFANHNNLYQEPERLHIIQQYMYNVPETHMIFLFNRHDIENDILSYECGWAIKPKDMPELKLTESPYTELYEETLTLVSVVELPVNIDTYFKSVDNLKSTLLKPSFDYMEKEHYKLNGDVIGIRISVAKKDNNPVQYVLLNVPITK